MPSSNENLNSTDLIYSSPHAQVKDFAFDAQVVEVFPDMISRSVPGYNTIIDTIGRLSQRFVKPNTQVYDLGCSLGAATLAMRKGIAKSMKGKACKIIAVDNSPAMIERCKMHINAFKGETKVEVIEANIQEVNIENASMVVLNFTLQFIDKNDRQDLINKIAKGINTGGILVISEKVSYGDTIIDEHLIDLHHDFKKANGYSELEVAQKRTALENVMRTDSVEQHIQRLKEAGFNHVSPWFQCFNFISFIAIK